MTHPRPGHLIVPLCLAALAVGVAPLFAQADEAPAAGPELTPSELYRDVEFLKVVAALYLTEGQVAKILPIVQRVTEHLEADEAADEIAFQQVEAAADAVTPAAACASQHRRQLAGRTHHSVERMLELVHRLVPAVRVQSPITQTRRQRRRRRPTLLGQRLLGRPLGDLQILLHWHR